MVQFWARRSGSHNYLFRFVTAGIIPDIGGSPPDPGLGASTSGAGGWLAAITMVTS